MMLPSPDLGQALLSLLSIPLVNFLHSHSDSTFSFSLSHLYTEFWDCQRMWRLYFWSSPVVTIQCFCLTNSKMCSIAFRSQGLKQSCPIVVWSQDDVFQIVSSLITGCCSLHTGSASGTAPWVSDGFHLHSYSLLFDITNLWNSLSYFPPSHLSQKWASLLSLTISAAAVLYCTVSLLIIQYGFSTTSLQENSASAEVTVPESYLMYLWMSSPKSDM